MDRERVGPLEEVVPHDLQPPIWAALTGERAAAVVSAGQALQQGLFCRLDLVGSHLGVNVRFNLDGPEGRSRPRIWLDNDGDVTLSQLLGGGGGGFDPGTGRWSFSLWFPLDPSTLSDRVMIVIEWNRLAPIRQHVALDAEAIRAAATQAHIQRM